MDSIRLISVNGRKVGLVGLDEVLTDMAQEYGSKSDSEVEVELLSRVTRSNYIPDQARAAYGRALVREFRKHLGQPFQEEPDLTLTVEVLGTGCGQCDRLTQLVYEALAELQLPADVRHVKDLQEISRYKVLGFPALLINGRIKSVGQVPPKKKIVGWLKEYLP